jgi:glutamyl-tRNA synthetase
MHVGNLRTALYAYLWAKKNKGTFILRIEDTDQERIVEGSVELIYRTLEETGLIHDEGPDKGGNYGPYIQHERKPIYRKYAEQLIEKGVAYYCFCDKERLEELRTSLQLRKLPFRYDGRCKKLSKEEVRQKLAAGVPRVVRQNIPTMGATAFSDEVYGTITVDNSTLDDQVLVKSDGLPTYNFANVVDDHLMEISHVIRGSEYLSSTPKYNLLYQAFGWEIPHYVHCSQVMRDAQHKLSKRDGDASYADFVEKGYLKEAIINYIALLGWNPGTEREKFTLEELVEAFDLGGISRSPAIFDVHKLTWLNGQFIREMPLENFHAIALPWIRKAVKREDIDLTKISRVLHERTEKLSDIPGQLDFIDALPDYSPELYVSKKMKTDPANSLESLKAILPMLESLPQWDHETLHREIFGLIEKRGVKSGLILWPLRIALSGKQFTPGGGVELADALGREESLRRIRKGIELLEKRLSG